MADSQLNTSYMGLELRNPIVVASSDLTKTAEGMKKCEAAGAGVRLPWQSGDESIASSVGVLARDAGQRHPGRRIASAKSWLSHDGVDRSADFLPWHGDADVPRMSPVSASSRYLAHLRAAWDHAHPDDPLDQQHRSACCQRYVLGGL